MPVVVARRWLWGVGGAMWRPAMGWAARALQAARPSSTEQTEEPGYWKFWVAPRVGGWRL